MTPFEYVSVLISLILGLGIAVILTGLARIIKRWESVVPYGPFFIWIVLVFVLHIQEWWDTYQLMNWTSWSLTVFLFVILYPILLFILANLLFPVKWKVPLDLKTYYFTICPKFFFFTICLALTALLQNLFLLDYSLLEQPVQLVVIILFCLLLIFRTEKAWVHYAVSLGLLLLLIGNLVLVPQQLGAR
jgi:hypothetical protein